MKINKKFLILAFIVFFGFSCTVSALSCPGILNVKKTYNGIECCSDNVVKYNGKKCCPGDTKKVGSTTYCAQYVSTYNKKNCLTSNVKTYNGKKCCPGDTKKVGSTTYCAQYVSTYNGKNCLTSNVKTYSGTKCCSSDTTKVNGVTYCSADVETYHGTKCYKNNTTTYNGSTYCSTDVKTYNGQKCLASSVVTYNDVSCCSGDTTTISGTTYCNSQVACSTCARPTLQSGSYIVQVGGNVDGNIQLYVQDTKKRVFCAQKGIKSPAYGSNGDNTERTCSSNYSMSGKLRAAIGYAINTCDNSSDSFFKVQKVIHKLLNTYNGGESVSGYDTTLYNNANDIYNKYGSESLGMTALSFTSSGNNWEGTAVISKTNIDSVSVTSVTKGSTALSASYAVISGNELTVTIPKSQITDTSTITVTITGTSTYRMATIKNCGSGIQPIALYDTTSETNTKTASSSGKIEVNGSLKIKKTNSSNDVLAQLTSSTTAKFKLYNNSSCTGTALKDFSAGDTVSNLTPGTYYLKEYQTKKGYHLPTSGEKWYCEEITITSGENEESVENKTECEYKFSSSMTMKERIDLYNLIKTNYSQEFNALLDMNNKTAANACKNIPITKSYDKSCFGATSTSTSASNFSNTNVSMYTEKYGTYTFCLTKYNMTNSLGKTNFNDIKSGQSIILTDNIVATATLNRVCHNFGDENITSTEYNNLIYSNYVSDEASIDGVKLIKTETTSGTINNKTITATYTLPVMYASNKDGRIYYGSCPSGEYCKIIGKGAISKFNLRPGTYDLKFDIKLNDTKLGSLKTSSDCKYTIANELIDYNNKLSIEFRPVNTNSDALFLGKDGTSDRKIGSNWSSEEDRNFVLKVKNNSYNKNNEEALYKITLTPDIIREIRENNKNKTYDDYNMTCVEDGTICISNYLTCLNNRNTLRISSRKNLEKFKTNQIICK